MQGHLPEDILRTFRAFLNFCYIVRRSAISESHLDQLEDTLKHFHKYRTIFETLGIRPNEISLPRQHSLIHYCQLIRLFGAPNGLCTSITELEHIRAVKEPWRRSNRNQPLGQMLITNQHLNQLAAAQINFIDRGDEPSQQLTV